MTDLTAEETSVLAAIEASPGIATREVAKIVQRQTQRTLTVVQGLLEKGLVESRPLKRVRADGIERRYNALWPVDPALCPRCKARKRHYEGGPECDRIKQLRLIGASIRWQRVPLRFGHAIQAGEAMWEQFLNVATYDELVAGIRSARFWRELNVHSIKQEAI
jgi:hypothetical protein